MLRVYSYSILSNGIENFETSCGSRTSVGLFFPYEKKRQLFFFVLFSLFFPFILSAQRISIRTNALYWMTTTPNAGLGIRLSEKGTAVLSFGYNPFSFPEHSSEKSSHNPKLMHWTITADWQYWFCRPYERWFMGVYGIYSSYNMGGVRMLDFIDLYDSRYKGIAAGGGLNCGYQWALGHSWGLEASLGIGYLFLDYDKFRSGSCGKLEESAHRHYFGPSRAAVSLIYYIK